MANETAYCPTCQVTRRWRWDETHCPTCRTRLIEDEEALKR